MSTELSVVSDITAVAFDRQEVACAKGLASGCLQFALIPHGESADNGVLKRGKKANFVIHERSDKVTSISFGECHSRVFCAVAYSDGAFCIYENRGGCWRHILTQSCEPGQKVVSVSWGEDERLAAAYSDHVTIFEMPEKADALRSVETVSFDVMKEHKQAFITFFSNSMFAVLSEDGWVQVYSNQGEGFKPDGAPVQVFVNGHGTSLCISGWCANDTEAGVGPKIAVAYRDNAAKEEVVRVIDVNTGHATEIWDRIWDGRIVALTWRGMGYELAITKAVVLKTETSAYIQLPDGTWVASKKSLF